MIRKAFYWLAVGTFTVLYFAVVPAFMVLNVTAQQIRKVLT